MLVDFWLADSPSGSPLYFLKNVNASVSGCIEDQEEDEDEDADANEEQGSEGSFSRHSFHFPGRRCQRHQPSGLGS